MTKVSCAANAVQGIFAYWGTENVLFAGMPENRILQEFGGKTSRKKGKSPVLPGKSPVYAVGFGEVSVDFGYIVVYYKKV